jgi:ribosomal protein S18 acetylase RimI-like enzyme
MAPADHTYRVRPASAADLPAVLTILTENQAGPPLPVPSAGRPSDRQKAAWERVLATADLTVYLAETGAEAAGTASMLLMPHLTYDCRPTAFIEAVVVRHAHRRRGVARACNPIRNYSSKDPSHARPDTIIPPAWFRPSDRIQAALSDIALC